MISRSDLVYTISAPGHLGDVLCMISAAHTFARCIGARVFVNQCTDVVRCYDDGLLVPGEGGVRICLDVGMYHRRTDGAPLFKNYLGTFVRPLLPELPLPTPFEFPFFPSGSRRCLIQPYSRAAPNPPTDFIQAIVDEFHQRIGEQLFAVGDTSTPRTIRGLDYSLLENSAPRLMEHIAAARCVFSPRSASAHIAAAYHTPAFLWLPKDGQNWHLDYDGWKCAKMQFELGVDFARSAVARFCDELLLAGGR